MFIFQALPHFAAGGRNMGVEPLLKQLVEAVGGDCSIWWSGSRIQADPQGIAGRRFVAG